MSIRRYGTEPPVRPNGSLWLWAGLELGFVGVGILLSATTSFAGRVPEEWDYLPQVSSISFSRTSVGLDERYLFHRATSRIQEVSKEQFEQEFAGSIGFQAAEVIEETGIASTVLLKTSSGNQLTTQNAYCAEGEGAEHALWLDGHPVKDHVHPCESVSCAEIVGDNLWLGTRHDGEYGDYPAQGIVVQTLHEGRLVKTLTTKQGLTGNLIRTIRLDPFDKTVWVATNEGINVVHQDIRVLKTFFFYHELDPETGNPKLQVSPAKRKSDPLAMMFVGLRASDPNGLHAAVSSIPMDVQERFSSESSDGQYGSAIARTLETAFAPNEMNVLVPFYIEAARSSDAQVRSSALSQICAFNDQRVVEFLMESDLPVATEPSRDRVGACLEKFMRFGLLSEQQKNRFELQSAEQKNAWVASMLEQEQAALVRIRASTRNDTSPDIKSVTQLARDLKQAGDRRGLDLINEYFRAMDGDGEGAPSDEVFARIFRDVAMYTWIGTNLGGASEIAPAMLEGLRKFKSARALRIGCWFFDMRAPGRPRRFDANHAEAILLALERGGPGLRDPPTSDTCAEAFKSQLGDPDVHRAFLEDVVPRLTPQQKALADKLASEPPKKICPDSCEEWCTCDG